MAYPLTSAGFWFASAGELVYGVGCSATLGARLAHRGVGRAFLVTDARLIELAEPLLASLDQAGIAAECCAQGEPEPSIAAAAAVVDAGRDFAPEAVIGLGGGSNIDLAKITATVLTHGGAPADYVGWDEVPGPLMPLVAIPTTAGTGSEVSHACVMTDTEAGLKVSARSRWLRPALALVDPVLTITCPPQVTADSGIDALTHAIEGYTAVWPHEVESPGPYPGKNPIADACAEQSVRLIAKHLARAVKVPDSLEDRAGMSLAATLGGLAFSNAAVAVVHALEYPIGAAWHCSHGAGNGLLLPYVMAYNLPERTGEFAKVAEWLGVDTAGLPEAQAAETAIEAVGALRETIGIPLRLRELGGDRARLPEFAAKAYAISGLMALNPRRPTEADLLGILEAAW